MIHFRAFENVATAMSFPSVIPIFPSVIPDPIGNPRCFIIGGGQIYAQALRDADRLIITHVHTVIEDADTFFPVIDPSVWTPETRSELFHDEESGYDFEFVEYIKR